MARRWLAPDFAPTRKLLLELHVSVTRETELLDLLSDWHNERSIAWQRSRTYSPEQIKAFYLLLLGLAQTDVLSSLVTKPGALAGHVDHMVAALFSDPPNRSSQ